jgi:hypothetical protein
VSNECGGGNSEGGDRNIEEKWLCMVGIKKTLNNNRYSINMGYLLVMFMGMNGIVRLIKSDMQHNTIMFVVLVPDEEDRNGDIISIDEITKTAHEFMINVNEKKVNVDHLE